VLLAATLDDGRLAGLDDLGTGLSQLGVSRWGSCDLAFEVQDDAFEVRFVKDLLALGGAEEEGSAAEVVDPAGDAFGLVVDGTEEAIAEELAWLPRRQPEC
jgi:hypothetical protein